MDYKEEVLKQFPNAKCIEEVNLGYYISDCYRKLSSSWINELDAWIDFYELYCNHNIQLEVSKINENTTLKELLSLIPTEMLLN